MSYSRQQIEDTVTYIVNESFGNQPSKMQQYIQSQLVNAFTVLSKANPKEIKLALDMNDPVLFSTFFAWLESQSISFPQNTRYVLKRDGQSLVEHNGDVRMICKKHKIPSKKHSAQYSEIIEALREFRLEQAESSQARAKEASFDYSRYEEDYHEQYEHDEEEDDDYGNQQGHSSNEADEYSSQASSEIDLHESSEQSFEYESSNEADEYSSQASSEIDSHKSSEQGFEYESSDEEQEPFDEMFSARKEQAAITFEHSNRSKSSRSLYYQAKKAVTDEKAALSLENTPERTDHAPVIRFANPKSDVPLKTTALLHAFNGHTSRKSAVPLATASIARNSVCENRSTTKFSRSIENEKACATTIPGIKIIRL